MPVDEIEREEEAEEAVEADTPEVALSEDQSTRLFPCHGCGADLEWRPGIASLACPYCGHAEDLPQDERAIREFAFNDYLADAGKQRGLDAEMRARRCGGCGAEVELAPEVAVQDCPFCGGMVEDAEAHAERIRPEAVVPCAVEREQARVAFKRWLRSRWFAPNKLAQTAVADCFQGVYRSWWTFDSRTRSHWSGQAGYYYYVTRRDSNGNTRRVRKTRWRNRSGIYEAFFDDILTCGFRGGLPAEGYRLGDAVPYSPQVLAGFVCERYAVEPQEAWGDARGEIESAIRSECKRRLGGDTQRFLRVDTAHSGITFKSILLPVWHATYRYNGKVYRVAVNGQTGAVTAERPWSWIKLSLLALAIIALAIGLYFLFRT